MAKLKILSIDGGGTRGIIPATILDCIFQDTGKHPLDIFDVIAGTSTGGIIALGLSKGVATNKLVDLYLKNASDIFHDSVWDDIRDGFGKNTGADYSTDRFKKILIEVFGEQTKLKNIHDTLGNDKHVIVTSFDLNPQVDGKNVNFRPVVYNSNYLRDSQELLVDLALRTSAGPTYFPIYQQRFIDGGVGINQPAMAAVAFAINNQSSEKNEYLYPDGKKKGLGRAASDIQVLSLGCGTSNKNYIDASKVGHGNWGNLQWVKYLPDLLTESNMQASDYYVSQVVNDEDYKRINVAFDCTTPPVPPAAIFNKVLNLDVKDPVQLQAMKDYAAATYQARRPEILSFLNLNAAIA